MHRTRKRALGTIEESEEEDAESSDLESGAGLYGHVLEDEKKPPPKPSKPRKKRRTSGEEWVAKRERRLTDELYVAVSNAYAFGKVLEACAAVPACASVWIAADVDGLSFYSVSRHGNSCVHAFLEKAFFKEYFCRRDVNYCFPKERISSLRAKFKRGSGAVITKNDGESNNAGQRGLTFTWCVAWGKKESPFDFSFSINASDHGLDACPSDARWVFTGDCHASAASLKVCVDMIRKSKQKLVVVSLSKDRVILGAADPTEQFTISEQATCEAECDMQGLFRARFQQAYFAPMMHAHELAKTVSIRFKTDPHATELGGGVICLRYVVHPAEKDRRESYLALYMSPSLE